MDQDNHEKPILTFRFSICITTISVVMSFQLTFVCLVQTIAGEAELTFDMMNPQPQHSNTQPTSMKTTRVGACEGGFQFEIKMAGIIGLRGLAKGHKFELTTNVKKAGNFDDLVYKADGRRYFLQLKHSCSPEKMKLTESDLEELLLKCFKSYCNIKQSDNFSDIPIDNSEFIIYTNRELHHGFLRHERKETEVDNIFITSNEKPFNFFPHEEDWRNLYTKLGEVVKKGKRIGVLDDQEIKSVIREFLTKLKIVTGQTSHWNLDGLIADEIFNNDKIKVPCEAYNSILYHFKTPLEMWWRSGKREIMTSKMLTEWLQRAKTEYYNHVVNSYKEKFLGTGIRFSGSEVSWLKTELSNEPTVHLRSDAPTLCSILLLDCLDTSKCIFVSLELLQCTKNLLVHAWLGGHWEWLIVFCDSTVQPTDISNTCMDICSLINPVPPNKYLIILTACSVHQIDNCLLINHKFKFEHLLKKSCAILLNKKVDFQGHEVTLRSVLQRHGNVEHFLGPELVTDLITEDTAVNIGGTLQVNEGYYAPRVLKRQIYLSLDVLKNSASYPDIFVVTGTTKSELNNIVPSCEILEYCSMGKQVGQIYDEIMDGRCIVLSEEPIKSHFSELCDTSRGKTLHWLKYISKDRTFLWKQSRGTTDNLLDYADPERTQGKNREFMKTGSCEVQEESIWKVKERTVLVVADAGMGKSSTTTQVAWDKKLADRTSWVVRINWNDHTRKLQEINAATFKLDALVEFLCSAAFNESKYKDFNKSLLTHALQNSGNVIVFMDGFDEICPIYEEKALIILREIIETKVKRVWVTSRTVQKERIEKELSVSTFTLKKLSQKCQEEMFRDIWENKAKGKKDEMEAYIKELLQQINELIYQRNLTGCPLNIIMIASALEEKLEIFLERGKPSLPGKLDILYCMRHLLKGKYILTRQMTMKC